jgi:sec-independent protein translocase protein TatA
MFGIGTTELIVVFLVILLLFGGRKIPEIARGIGKGIREFKKAKDGIEDSLKEEEDKEKKQ